jgi:hypothetical protein
MILNILLPFVILQLYLLVLQGKKTNIQNIALISNILLPLVISQLCVLNLLGKKSNIQNIALISNICYPWLFNNFTNYTCKESSRIYR